MTKTAHADLARVLAKTLPQAYYVGGIVRNSLLKRYSADIDLALPAQDVKPAALLLAKKLKAAAFEMDAEYGVWRVVSHRYKIQIDLTAFQGKNLKADLLRRDFTCNALAYPVAAEPQLVVVAQKTGNAQLLLKRMRRAQIIDYAGGLTDIKEKCIRATNPRVFEDDPLRMLRAFRSAAELKFTISVSTRKLIQKCASQISRSAGERVHEELRRLFQTSCAYKHLVQMNACGLLTALLPDLEPQRSCAEVYYGAGGVLKHTLEVFRRMEYLLDHVEKAFPAYARQLRYLQAQKPLFKMTALLHDVAKPATAKIKGDRLRFFYHEQKGARMARTILERLHYSRPDMRLICAMIGEHLRPSNLASNDVITDRGAYHFFRDLGDAAVPLLFLCWADYTSYVSDAQLRRILPHSQEPMMSLAQAQKRAAIGKTLRHLQVLALLLKKFYKHPHVVKPSRVITGRDIMDKFSLPSGPQIGELLEAVAVAQVEGKVQDKKEALAFLASLLESRGTTQKNSCVRG